MINVKKATPIIAWSAPNDIVYGTVLSETQLNAKADVEGTFTYTQALGTKLNAGNNQELKVDFVPTDAANYEIVSKTVTINVKKATPVITWTAPSDIVYGTTLSETQLNAKADVEGTFTYTPVSGTKLNAGNNQELKVDFVPTDAANYESTSKTVLINVKKATPVIAWSAPNDIVYGTVLNETQLNAKADVDGIFTYTPALGTKLSAGNNQELKVDFTPTDAANYESKSKTVTINVKKATPVIEWLTPSDIVYGTTLSEMQLNAKSDVEGIFTYTPGLGTKLSAGNNQELKVNFTPTDAANYESTSKMVLINVKKATPVITWSVPTDIVYGTTLSETQLNAKSDVDGTFTYSPVSGTKLNAGNNQELKVDFTPTDKANYESIAKTVLINVKKATPVITWTNPADIVYGTTLSETQLNAKTDVDGKFTYTPALSTKLSAGNNQELKVDFTPTDAANYESTSKMVLINVKKATPVIEWLTPSDIVYGTVLSETQLNAKSDVEGIFTYTPALGAKLSAGNNQELKVDFVPTDAANYESTSKTVLINVLNLILTVSPTILNFQNTTDSIQSIFVTSNYSWVANVDSTWLRVNPTSGTGNKIINVSVDTNNSNKTRNAIISFSSSGTWFQNVFISQEPKIINGLSENQNNKINLFPNPATNSFSINGFDGKIDIIIYDVNGIRVLSKKVISKELIVISSLSEGLYLIKLITSDGTVEKKLIKN